MGQANAMVKIGGHVSAAVSLDLTFERAAKIGAECFQFFISPPQQWIQLPHSEQEFEQFKVKKLATGIGPNFIHGTYLINLGASNPEHLQKSIDWLIYAQKMAGKLGVEGTIFHLGSHKGAGFKAVIGQVVDSLKKVLNSYEGKTKLILETSAGAGGSIGSSFRELGEILKRVGDDKSIQGGRLKICLDSAHVFAAGYDIRTPLGMKDLKGEFEEQIGLQNLVVIHANDSKFDLKSGKDRHQNIGEGFIGRDGFRNFMNQTEWAKLPFILEVPGYADKGADLENIAVLKSLIK